MATKKKILVTGANGQLGNELRVILSSTDEFEYLLGDLPEMPIDDQELLTKTFGRFQPDFCVNCAAYTAVDKAEEERALAMQVNATAVGILAAVCKKHNTRFLHVSTDYVFDGKAGEPYTEESPTDPVNFYGESKLRGEEECVRSDADSIIIRTSWVYSKFGKNFVKTMLKLMGERPEISVVSDQVGSPTYAADLAGAIVGIIRGQNWQPGIYHYSNEGIISWYDFAVAIRDLGKRACQVKPISTSQYPTPAKRPAYSVMDKSKFIRTFGIPVKPWKDSLGHCIQRIVQEA